MQTPAQTSTTLSTHEDEYITIVAPTLREVMQQFRESGLAAEGYSIAGQVARHRFSYAGDAVSVDLFGGIRMIAATFIRTTSAQ